MSSITPRLSLTYLIAGQAHAVEDHNAVLNMLDAMIDGRVLSATTGTPPVAVTGDCYIIPATGTTGEWVGLEGQVAAWFTNAWVYLAPVPGMMFWVEDESAQARYVGTAWVHGIGESVFAARRTTAISLSTGGTNITWNAEDKKNAQVFTHDTTTNPEQITLVEAGVYFIWADVTMDVTSGTGTVRGTLELTINGTAVTGCKTVTPISNTEDQITASIAACIVASAGDILRVKMTMSGGTPAVSTLADSVRLLIQKK